MSNSVSLDLETLGKLPGCPVVSIGWCIFNENDILTRGELHPYLKSQLDAGAKLDADTLQWWMRQSDEARMAWVNGQERQGMDLRECLKIISGELQRNRVKYIYGFGATFDVSILQALYVMAGLPIPWQFWNIRCGRTLTQLADIKIERDKKVHHTAEQDAFAQAQAFQAALKKLALLSNPTAA